MTTLEWIAALLGVACVALVVRRSMWNFPFAIVSVTLFGFVFWNARLYSDALLQGFFVAINLYGWWNWARTRGEVGEVVVEGMDPIQRVAAVSATIGLALGWGAIMASRTDAAYPYVDAAVAVISIAAQILQARRKLECWVGWIIVDLIAIPLYLARDLHAAAALYLVYLALSVWGLVDWRRRLARGGAAAVA